MCVEYLVDISLSSGTHEMARVVAFIATTKGTNCYIVVATSWIPPTDSMHIGEVPPNKLVVPPQLASHLVSHSWALHAPIGSVSSP